MNKIFLGGLALTLCSGVAFAQELDNLFPELKGQFEQAPAAQEEVIELELEVEQEGTPAKPNAEAEKPVADKKASQSTSATAKEEKDDSNEKPSGNLVIRVQNVDGVLPYARTLSYCTAEAALTNETNKWLEQLSLTVTYKDMSKTLAYSNVSPKKTRTKKFMLIGLPCEDIKGMPKVDVKTCKLKNQSEDDCKKRVQFLPPGG